MRLKVGDILYLKPDFKLDDLGYISRDGIKITLDEMINTPIHITHVRKSQFCRAGIKEDDICIEWFDGMKWWWGQIGSFEPWTIMFIPEKQYLRNRSLSTLGISMSETCDYEIVDGYSWNKRPINDQLEILKKWYPIGSKVVLNDSVMDALIPIDNIGAFIEGHLNYIGGNSDNFYILSIRYYYKQPSVIESSLDEIHPGFFKPDIVELRNTKLKKILE